MRRLFAILAKTSRDPQVRQWLLWCLPALALAFLVRAFITIVLPWGIYHDDTPDFLHTADKVLLHHHWALNPKKTFLVPALYTIPFLLRLPALFIIPLAQHILGLGCVLMGGALCRLWFTRWKIWIIPVTLILAVDPGMLWYEHTLIAESVYLFTTLLVIVAATLYAKVRSTNRFIFLCGCLVLEAGARPEGKLFFGFAFVLLCLLHLRELRLYWLRFAVLAGLGFVMHLATPTSQAGLLLYTSVARFTPPDLKCAPDFEPFIAPIRADLVQRWNERQGMPKVADRRLISKAVADYLKHHHHVPGAKRGDVNKQCMKMASEICRRIPQALPGLIYAKFRYSAHAPVSNDFSEKWIVTQQIESVTSSIDKASLLSWGLTWKKLKTDEQWQDFIEQHYPPQEWFNEWYRLWGRVLGAVHLPASRLQSAHGTVLVENIPVYFVLAAVGLGLAFFRRREQLQLFHLAWGAFVIGFFMLIILTANTKPRFRFVFEPLWFIYLAVLADSLIGPFFWRKRGAAAAMESAASEAVTEVPSATDVSRSSPSLNKA